MSKIITKSQLNLVIESTLKEVGVKMIEETCPECGGMIKEGLCESGCGSDNYMDESDAKPDFLDLDGDGDTEEPMKKAAKDKEKMEKDEVEESVDELTESLLKTTNNEILKEEMDFFNKMIKYGKQ